MAWTAPMTAVENAIFTSTQFNTYVRDNMLVQAPALATTSGQYPVGVGANSIAMRTPSSALVATPQTTTSATYTNLATTGPAVTATTSTCALVLFFAVQSVSVTNNATSTNVWVSGATTISPSDDNQATYLNGVTATNTIGIGGWAYFNTLTPGSNTFTLKYRVNGGATGTFSNRRITVLPM
jgi:hypothetical protein